MDDRRFDRLVMTWTSGAESRRGALRLVAGAALGGLLARAGLGHREAAAAACKGDRKACRRGGECCSGVCKRGRCRPAPGQGTCTIAKDACRGGAPADVACHPDGGEGCFCFRRPNGAAFCADTTAFDCLPCAECPAGTVCVRAPFATCSNCSLGTICVRPCAAGSD